MKNILFGLMLLLVLSSCREYEKSAIEETTVVEEAVPMAMMAPEGTGANTARAYPEQKIIKHATLRFETDDLSQTAAAVMQGVRKYKAQVQSDAEGNSEYSLNRTMIIRIPAQHFEGFIADISKGVKYFDTKQVSSEDVTEQYIDTEARIKAKKVLEARYLELIGKAKKVSEVLEIEKELSAIREEIEAKEGQLRYMKDRVALSTIHIEFYKTIETAPDATVSYGSKMWNAIKSGFNGVSSFFIQLLHIWPFILIFVIAFIIIRKKLKKRKQYV